MYSIDKTSRASGGKCIGALKRQGDSIVFDVESREDREAEMQIFINRPEDYVFEDKFILRVNGNPITVGNVEGTGNDGTFEGIYFSFFVPVKVSVPLVRGANTIEFVAVEGENLDCLVIR